MSGIIPHHIDATYQFITAPPNVLLDRLIPIIRSKNPYMHAISPSKWYTERFKAICLGYVEERLVTVRARRLTYMERSYVRRSAVICHRMYSAACPGPKFLHGWPLPRSFQRRTAWQKPQCQSRAAMPAMDDDARGKTGAGNAIRLLNAGPTSSDDGHAFSWRILVAYTGTLRDCGVAWAWMTSIWWRRESQITLERHVCDAPPHLHHQSPKTTLLRTYQPLNPSTLYLFTFASCLRCPICSIGPHTCNVGHSCTKSVAHVSITI